MGKFYAIKEGMDIKTQEKVENKIVTTWDECTRFVKGVKGAKYKSFTDLKSAEDYLMDTGRLLKKNADVIPEGFIHAYVDGSFNDIEGKYSYGLVVVKNDIIVHLENGVASDDTDKALRQIAGELAAAKAAVKYSLSAGERNLAIIHDYEGIFHHATGSWARRDKSSVDYYEFMNKYISSGMLDIVFIKVDSHTGDTYNELADEAAKVAAGLKLNNITKKYLATNKLKVTNEAIKGEILAFLTDCDSNNIVVTEN